MKCSKKIWFFALVGLIVLGIGIHVFLREKTPTEPIQIYKATQPTPKPRPLQTDTAPTQPPTIHDHSHDQTA